MYAVEAEFIDRVVRQYGPCKSLRRCLRCTSHSWEFSHKGRCHRCWADFRQGAGKSRLRSPSPAGCSHCLLALTPRSHCFPGWSPIGSSLVTALSLFHTSHLSSSRSSSSTVPQMKASRSSRAYSTVSNHAMSTSPTRITTSSPPTSKRSLTLPSSRMSPSSFVTGNILTCLTPAWVQRGLPNTRIPGNKASMSAVSRLSRSTSCFASIPTNGTFTPASLS